MNCPWFQYSLDYPHLNMTNVENNRVIQIDMIKLDNERMWISPIVPLYLHMSHNIFMIRYAFMSCIPQNDRLSSHQLRNCDRQICMKMYLRTDLSSLPLGCGVSGIRCLPLYRVLWNKREIPLPLQTRVWLTQ